MGFMLCITAAAIDNVSLTIGTAGQFNHIANGSPFMRIGAKVVGACQCRLGPQDFGQAQVTAQWLQHMLPRANGLGVTNAQGLARLPSPYGVWNESILRPVAAANHVAGARARDRNALLRQKGVAVARN